MNFSLKTVSTIYYIYSYNICTHSLTVNSGDNEHVASGLYLVNGSFVLIL